MKLKEWIDKYGIKSGFMAIKLNLHRSYMSSLVTERVRPSKKLAKQIEEFTKGEVTVKDLRGEVATTNLHCAQCGVNLIINIPEGDEK